MPDTPLPNQRRNVALLSMCWALVSTSMMMVVTVSALVGSMLSPDKSLFALPIALQWIGTALMTGPASFIMRALGRRNGFWIASVIMAVGAAIAVVAIVQGSFTLFCIASAAIGAGTGFTWYYRFAAAEVASDGFRAKAISLVLAGGVVAALAGPTLARYAVDWLTPYTFAGGFVAIIALHAGVAALLAFVRVPQPKPVEMTGARPMLVIARQPRFVVAVASGVVAYTVMVVLMSVTPRAMQMCGLTFADATHVIQWHVLGMYVPAFFTGYLINWLGVYRVIFIGGFLKVVCIGIAAAGESFMHFWAALLILGVAWNFLYVGATTLLTGTYTVAERAKAQAFNEVTIFVVVGIGTFFSGMALEGFGWTAVVLGTLPFVLVVMGGIAWLAWRGRNRQDTRHAT